MKPGTDSVVMWGDFDWDVGYKSSPHLNSDAQEPAKAEGNVSSVKVRQDNNSNNNMDP